MRRRPQRSSQGHGVEAELSLKRCHLDTDVRCEHAQIVSTHDVGRFFCENQDDKRRLDVTTRRLKRLQIVLPDWDLNVDL